VRLEVFDLRGRRVRTLKREVQDPGFYQLVWDGMSDEGQAVASGVFFVRLQTESSTVSRKILRLK